MIDRITSLLESAGQALRLVLDRAVAIDWWWVALGVVLYELAQGVRTRGWFNILRAAYPKATGLRARDVLGAYLAGVGLNAVLPVRGGDFLKLFMVRRRVAGARYSTLIATFLPETLFESACGAALVIWALAHGFMPVPLSPDQLPELDISLVMAHPIASAAAAAVLGVAAVLVVRWLRARARRLVARLRRGLAILRTPRDFILGVASWQALSRLLRLAALACFIAAVGLPVTLNTALLAMAAQGAGRIIPLAPASAGIRVAMLAYGFVEITDTPVDMASISAFWLLAGGVHLIASIVVGLTSICVTFGTASPRRALAAARQAAASAAAAVPATSVPADAD